MAKWGDFDYKEFERFADRFKKLADGMLIEQFIREFLEEMAWRAIRKIKKRTPVGVGTPQPGNLRDSWKIGDITKNGDTYEIEIYNDANYNGEQYASFVEYGHRVGKNLIRWVEGRFMMTVSMKEIERELPRYLERRLDQWLREMLGG